MRTIIRDFTYFDRSFDKGDRVPDNDPLVALFPDLFEPAKPKKQPGGQPPKPKEA